MDRHKTIYNCKITYTMDEEHPDIQYVKDWTPEKVFEFSDTYFINKDYFNGEDHIRDYIINDLKLVAGGGYDCKHIHNVRIVIKKKKG